MEGLLVSCMVWSAVISVALAFVYHALKLVNWWKFELPLGAKRFALPPGDLGLPFIGNMISFICAWKWSSPDNFIKGYTKRYASKDGIYKSVMFCNPSIIVTRAEACKRVLSDDETFKPGWPSSAVRLMGRKSFIGITDEEHRRLRKITAAPVNGHESLSMYLTYIEENVVEALEKWSSMGNIEFLTMVRKLTFKIIMHIFLSSESEEVAEMLEKEYTTINYGVRAMPINIWGFAFYDALKARVRLVRILNACVRKRRELRAANPSAKKEDMLDLLLETKGENGQILDDEEITDILVMYLNAGHESSGHNAMWATLFLQENPEIMKRAKDEQEEIVRSRPADQEGLTYNDIRKMNYLSKVVDETLRLVTFSSMVFREARKDVQIGDYLIPEGWKVIVWFRSIHHDPILYEEPMKFDPERWEGFTPRPGTYVPFGLGGRLCPGNDLAKLEITVFLHYFLLNYKLERKNPNCAIKYLPHPRPKDNCYGKVIKIQS